MADGLLGLHFTKSYPGFALELDLELGPEVTAIFGPSGSGKTTTLDCIAGLGSPNAGRITLAGRSLFSSGDRTNLRPERRGVGYVFQDSLLFPHLSVRDNLLYGYRRTPPSRRRTDPDTLIELLDLGPLLERHQDTLSGGEARRVALARAVAASPELLLLDEPLGSLDATLRGRVLRYLGALHRELGLPILYVSHSLSEVLALAHRAIVLSHGSVVADGAPHRLLGRPEVAPMVEMAELENLLDAEVTAHKPESGLTEVMVAGATLWVPLMECPTGATVSLALRAADILVATQPPQGISARNVLPASVRELHSLPGGVLVAADAGPTLLAEISPAARDALGLMVGQRVFLVVKSSSIAVRD